MMIDRRSAAIVYCITAVAAAATAAPARLDIRLEDVRWQVLPVGVETVHVGPDHRAWYVVRDPNAVTSIDELKAVVAGEFHRPDPQIPGTLRIALFEPGGRVWFTHVNWANFRSAEEDPRSTKPVGRLLGYDGKSWVEREAPRGHNYFNGNEPGHGRGRGAGNQAYVAGRAFFVSMGVVHCFDGAGWSTREFWSGDRPRNRQYAPELYPEPDGNGLVAQVPLGSGGLWRWRDGMWSSLRLPEPLASKGHVSSVAATSRGVWVAYVLEREEQGLAFVPYADVGDADGPEATRLIRLLEIGDFAARERATSELARLGKAAVPELRRAIERTSDLEFRNRLTQAMSRINAAESGPPVIPPAAFGAFTVRGMHFLFGVSGGTVVVGAKRITKGEREIGPGVLRMKPDGDVSLIDEGERSLARWRYTPAPFSREVSPLVAGAGRYVWTSGNGDDIPPALIDLRSGRAVASLPAADYFREAVASDGTLYAANTGRVLVFRPAARDNVAVLDVDNVDLASPVHAVDSAGMLWAQHRDSHVLRKYDGRAWHDAAPLGAAARVSELLPGSGGAMIVNSGVWTLHVPGKQPTAPSGSLSELVERNADAVVAGYGARSRSRWTRGATSGC